MAYYGAEELIIAERVALGAKLMDREKPGWESLLDWDKFDITQAHVCVLGQLYVGGYWRAVRTLWASLSEERQSAKAKEHGFTAQAFMISGGAKLMYKTAWKTEAEKRMNPFDLAEPEAPAKPEKLKFSSKDKDRMARALVMQASSLSRDKSISGLSERAKDLIDAEVREINELLAKLGR